MNPERRNLALSAVDAAARRLLVRVIDLRFCLEDAADAIDGDLGPGIEELWQLRADADLICREIDSLTDALWPAAAPGGVNEESVDAAEVCGA